MKRLHFVMPMAGRGSRFGQAGYGFPKPLIKIYNKPFFYWATQSICRFVETASLDFIVLKEHIDNFFIDHEIISYFPEARIHVLPDVTEGAVITCLKGISNINDDMPVLFNDCDHLFKSTDFNRFCEEGFDDMADGLLLTFESGSSSYSYVRKDHNGNVVQTVEKSVISDEAICGSYYFRNKDIFMSAAKKYLTQCHYSEYFMSGVYNTMVEENYIVKSMKTDFHVSFGTPEEYEQAEKSEKYKELMEWPGHF